MALNEKQMSELAKNNPKELARILTTPKTDIRTLTFGIEILATETTNEDMVLPALKMLLKHMHATVREGALTGVQAFYNADKAPPDDIIQRLRFIATHDPSPILKDEAKSLLEDLETK